MSRTALSMTQICPGQRSAWLSYVPDSAQQSAWLSYVRDSTQHDSALSRTSLSMTQPCPGQHSAWLSYVPDSNQVSLSAVPYSAQHDLATYVPDSNQVSLSAVIFNVTITGLKWRPVVVQLKMKIGNGYVKNEDFLMHGYVKNEDWLIVTLKQKTN